MPRGQKVTYVLPVYNEAESLPAFHDRLIAAADLRPDLQFEFIYVDDGSADASLVTLIEMKAVDDRVSVISLSRNFGHQLAVTAGLDTARDADAVIVMDTDLQDPPEVSAQMIGLWEGGADVVYAQRRSRRDTPFKRLTAWLFYRVLDKMASVRIPRNTGDFRLLDRRVVAEVSRYREHDRFLRGIVAHVGFRQEAILFDRDERRAGRSKYPLRKMLDLAADGLVGFSTVPLRLISRLGYAISLFSLLLALYVLWVRLFQPEQAVPGWAFLGVGMFMLGGVQMVMMGVIGTYLARIYVQTQGRPLYSVALLDRAADVSDPGPELGRLPRSAADQPALET